MGALASMLQDLGFRVTGSDGPLYPPMSHFIDSRKIPRTETYTPENLRGARWGFAEAHPTLIIIGNAISRSNLEAQFAEELVASGRSSKMSFAQALAEFCIRDRESFVVAGTHGKTSTTTQLAWALESLGEKPGFFIGGIPANFSEGCRMGEGTCFASEGDEYDTAYWDKESKFLHYRPSWVLCTGIEFDHADIYANIEAIEKSFHKLITKTKTGWIHVDVESAPRADVIRRLEDALRASGLRHLSYGRSPSSAYRLVNLSEELVDAELGVRGSVVEIETPRWGLIKVSSALSGEHNALNLVGIVAVLSEADKIRDPAQIQTYLRSFRGVKRRQEELYSSKDLIVIDDFAHHPTAIRETIRAIRKKYPRYDVAAFFEPRSATSARNVFQKEFTDCFDDATKVYLTPPTKTNVPEAQKLDVYQIQKDLEQRGVSTFVTPDVNEIATRFKTDFKARPDDSRGMVALVMSNGAFGGLHQKLFEGRGQGLRTEVKGQAVVEWLILCFVLVIISVAILAPLRAKFTEIQNELAANTLDVMEQKTLGIPIRWFELEDSGDLDEKFNRLMSGLGGSGENPGGAPGGEAGGRGGKDPNAPGDGGSGRDTASDGGASPDGSSSSSRRGSRSSTSGASGDVSSGSGASGSTAKDEGYKAGENKLERSRGGGPAGSGGDNSFSGESGGNDNRDEKGVVSGTDESKDKEGKDDAVDKKKKSQAFDGRDSDNRKRGCDNVDYATLIKLFAILGIIVIGAILVLSGRGGGKNNT